MDKLKAILLAILVAVIALVLYRGYDFTKCGVASYDLNRKTGFSWVTGNCMVERPSGERVYLHMLRGMEGE